MVISVVFGTPLAGIVGNLERDEKGEKPRKRLLRKRGRIILYCAGVLGGLLAAMGLSKLLSIIADATANEWFIEFAKGGGLPRFDSSTGLFGNLNADKLMWVVPLMLAGIVLAFIYKEFDKITKFLADKIAKHRIISCLIAGLCVAVCGWLLPSTMFSGEHQLGTLIGNWQTQDATVLILTSVVKIILVSVCINFGWRGGSIFPIIFCGSSAAFAMALIIGPAVLDGAFAAAILVSAMYSYINRKPFMAVLILLLCFPISYFIPMLIVGYAASKIPTPFKEAE
ncbi:MAG: chloride channel protein [Oscillospiraceae bacterium]|nr:chloride channel protein [Candidatus Equicaccousia limihippi]